MSEAWRIGPRSRRSIAIAALAALVVGAAARVAERGERVVRLSVECVADRCRGTAGDGAPLEVRVEPDLDGNRAGVYVYHPWDRSAAQRFRNFNFTPAVGGPSVRLDLSEPHERAAFAVDARWRVTSGGGLRHEGAGGERSLLLLSQRAASDFSAAVDLVEGADAGLIVRARSNDDGLLFVAREQYNDLFFVRLTEGAPGPILAIAPLRTLSAAREALGFAGLLAEAFLAALLFVALVRAAGALLPDLDPRGGSLERLGRALSTPRALAAAEVALFAATVIALSFVAVRGFGAMPHLQDEVAYLFQARIFAAGHLFAPAPPLPAFFAYEHLIVDGGRWFAKYPPLFPLLLSGGVRIGMPWIVNPLLGGLTGLAIARLTRELCGDRRWGLAAWCLALVSPWFLIMGATHMAHVAAALFVALALLALLRLLRDGGWQSAVGLGLALAALALTRPYTALLTGLVVALAVAIALARGTRERPRLAVLTLIAAACAGVGAAGHVAWNATLAPRAAAGVTDLYTHYDADDRLGFGADRGAGWLLTWGDSGHTPAKAWRSVRAFFDAFSRQTLGWPWRLSTALVFVWLLAGSSRARGWPLLALLGALAAGHMLYWATQFLVYGARYWFEALPGLFALSALGWRALASRSVTERPERVVATLGARQWSTAVLVLGLAVWNFAYHFPDPFRELEQYAGVRPELAREVRARALEGALVFVPTQGLSFNPGFHLNDPFLRGNLYARDLGARNAELIDARPDLQPFRWDGARLLPLDADRARGTAP